MKFSLYNILSSLLHGFLLLFVFLYVFDPVFKLELNVGASLFCLAISYFLGFFINALGSLLEQFYFFLSKGRPSAKLLDGGKFMKIELYEAPAIKAALTEEAGIDSPSNDYLFSIAKRKTRSNQLVLELDGMYAFSRSALIMSLILSTLLFVKFYHYWLIGILCIVVVVGVLWYRYIQFAYYYSVEVYSTYLTLRESQSKTKLRRTHTQG